MKEIIKRYWLIIIILVAVIIGIISLLVSGENNNNQNQEFQLTPTNVQITITPTAPPAAKSGFGPNLATDTGQIKLQNQELDQNRNDYPLAGLLPYKTNLFTIDHYRGPRQLVVMIKKETDKNVVQEKINNWLLGNKFEATSHKIIWTISN